MQRKGKTAMSNQKVSKLKGVWKRVLNVGFAALIGIVLLISTIVWTFTAYLSVTFVIGLFLGYSLAGGLIALVLTAIPIVVSWFLFKLLWDLVAEFRLHLESCRGSAGP